MQISRRVRTSALPRVDCSGSRSLAVSLRGVVMIRQIAALHGVRPGLAVTISLLRRIATTAAGTSGAAFLSQTLADHLLTTTPGVKHVAAAIPGAGTAAF